MRRVGWGTQISHVGTSDRADPTAATAAATSSERPRGRTSRTPSPRSTGRAPRPERRAVRPRMSTAAGSPRRLLSARRGGYSPRPSHRPPRPRLPWAPALRPGRLPPLVFGRGRIRPPPNIRRTFPARARPMEHPADHALPHPDPSVVPFGAPQRIVQLVARWWWAGGSRPAASPAAPSRSAPA